MKKLLIFLTCIWCFAALAQRKVILDTDPSYDPDDAGCMAMIHSMASEGQCEIVAMINSTDHQESSLSISAINYFYNRKAIPVGDYKGYAEKVQAPDLTYDGALAREYPRALKSWEESLDGVRLYREILATAEDRSITVVIIGTMHNFYGLLQSDGDEYSPLPGRELVKLKVEQVVTMGGNFIDGKGLDRTNWGGSEELCSYTDWSCVKEERNRMCRYVIENCEAPFIASGWEVGCGDYYDANYGNVMTGQGLKQLPTSHIIRRSYEYHFDKRGGSEDISRHSNDQCALHYALLGESNNYEATLGGKITLTKDGQCQWEEHPSARQGYIQKKRSKELIAKEIEALMMGEALAPDNTPPSVPSNLQMKGGKLHWEPSMDDTKGSWVVAYDVKLDGQNMARVYGTQFVGKVDGQSVEVSAVNVNGIVGQPAVLELR